MPCKNHYKKVHYNKKFSEIFFMKKILYKTIPGIIQKNC